MSRKRKLGIWLAGMIVAAVVVWLLAELFPNRQSLAAQHFGERGAAVGFQFHAPQWVQDILRPWGFGRRLLYRTGSLTSILLKDVALTDADLEHLDNCPDLEILLLEGCQVNDDLIHRLPSFDQLSELSLSNVSDDDLSTIGELTRLTVLSVDGAEVTDEGVAQLSELKSLERLSLMQTQVTDACIPQMCAMPKLRMLHLQHTQVTAEGAAALSKEHPQTQVYQ